MHKTFYAPENVKRGEMTHRGPTDCLTDKQTDQHMHAEAYVALICFNKVSIKKTPCMQFEKKKKVQKCVDGRWKHFNYFISDNYTDDVTAGSVVTNCPPEIYGET